MDLHLIVVWLDSVFSFTNSDDDGRVAEENE